MEPNDPRPPTEADREKLASLEQRLSRAGEAAAQLAHDAASSAGDRLRPPAAGWAPPDAPAPREGPDPLEGLVTLVEALRGLVPPDLMDRLTDAVRELLLAARALIDWWLERSESRRTGPVEVQDIPIS